MLNIFEIPIKFNIIDTFIYLYMFTFKKDLIKSAEEMISKEFIIQKQTAELQSIRSSSESSTISIILNNKSK